MAEQRDLEALLIGQSMRLDVLIREAHEVRSQAHYDELEGKAQSIAAEIVAAFRKSPAGPPSVRVTPGRRGGVWAH